MKISKPLTLLLAAAFVLLCAKVHFLSTPAIAADADANVVQPSEPVAEAATEPAPAFHDFDVHAEFAENPFTWFTGPVSVTGP